MKTRLKIAFFSLLTFVAFSCDKTNDGTKIPFSELTVEENKEVVETSAIKAAQAFDEMKDLEVVDASVSLGTLLDTSDPISARSSKKSKVTNTINAIAGLQGDNGSINGMFSAMAAPDELLEDEPETIQEVWEEIVGIYDWNPMSEDWDYTPNSEKVELNFPSTTDGTTNDAKLTISNYEGVFIASPLEGEYDGDLPVSLNMDLTVGTTTLMSYTFAAEYDDDGIPTSVASDLTMDPFVLSVDISNTEKKISAMYKFTHNNDIVMEISGKVEGDFSDENIEANTETFSETYQWTDWQWNESTQQYEQVTITEVDEWEEVAIEEIAQSGDFKFQLYSISIIGVGDIKAIGDSLDLIYPDDYWDDENFNELAATQMEAALLNNNLHIYALDEDSKKKIADVEAYVVEDSYGYGYTEYWVDFRLKFGDGSYVDMETYFEEGFEDFVAEINQMIDELNMKYDWNLDDIDY